jgi:Pentapeptide repeats (8 copies)
VDTAREGQIADLYSRAIEQLGSDKIDVRIGGIYALERVVRESAADHPTVMEVLTAFIREHSHEQWPPPDHPASGEQERSTRPDVQAAITVIGRRDRQLDETGIGPAQAGLPRRILARMGRIDLAGASLTRAFLFRADLTGANLVDVDFTGAVLAGADLTDAHLDHANLFAADLTGAVLEEADLTGVSLDGDKLNGASLAGANLTEASLHGAGFAYVNFFNANLTGANLTGADLTGVDFADAEIIDAWWPADTPVPEG